MTLRRVLMVASVLALVAGSPAMAGPQHPRQQSRVVTISYSQACAVALVAVHEFTVDNCSLEQAFDLKIDEYYASIKIADDSGKPVGIAFHLASEVPPPATLFCAATRLRLEGLRYNAHPAMLMGSADCPYPPTSGTITVTLFRR